MYKIATVLFVAVLISGCAHEIWTGPQSAEGRSCVAQCMSGKQQCESINAAADRLANSQCQNEYNRQMRDYQQCEQQNRSSSAEDRCTAWDDNGNAGATTSPIHAHGRRAAPTAAPPTGDASPITAIAFSAAAGKLRKSSDQTRSRKWISRCVHRCGQHSRALLTPGK
ncbi:MAG: hypothetical protein PHT19_12585 [Methylococcus sp.]|nr:hypothetical protein [Methylococcus sp.]